MKNSFSSVALLLTLSLLVSCEQNTAASSSNNSGSSINWHNNFNNALQIAEMEDKPIMLDLYTDWCTWCQELDATTFTDKSVVEKARGFIAVKINPEEDELGEELIEEYNIQGYPAIVFLNKNGEMLTKVNGYVEAQEFLSSMELALVMPTIIAEIESGNNKNIEAIDYYMNLGELELAIATLDEMVASGKVFYIDGSSKNISELDTNFIVAKYFDIGMKYMYELGNLEAAQKLYEKLAREHQDSDYIFSIDICILNIYMANDDADAMIKYIENTAMKRNNLPSEYAEMYESVLADFQGDGGASS